MYMPNLSIKIRQKTMDELFRLYHLDRGRRQWDVYVRQFLDDAVNARLKVLGEV